MAEAGTSESHTLDVGTYYYMDPHCGGRNHSYGYDTYSLGIVLFELCSFFTTGMEPHSRNPTSYLLLTYYLLLTSYLHPTYYRYALCGNARLTSWLVQHGAAPTVPDSYASMREAAVTGESSSGALGVLLYAAGNPFHPARLSDAVRAPGSTAAEVTIVSCFCLTSLIVFSRVCHTSSAHHSRMSSSRLACISRVSRVFPSYVARTPAGRARCGSSTTRRFI